MVRVDRHVVRERLERMLSEVEAIELDMPLSGEDFSHPDNETLRYAIEHRLYIALQAALDTASHIAVVGGYRPITSYRDAMAAMLKMGVAGPELQEFLDGAPGLRNALAHEYLDLDCERVYSALQRLDDVKRFAAAVWEWVEGQ